MALEDILDRSEIFAILQGPRVLDLPCADQRMNDTYFILVIHANAMV